MLSINGHRRRVCTGLSRRELLQAGGAGLFGLSLPQILAAEAAAKPFEGARAKSVIFLYLFGGPSQLETFDMKPEAPSTLRGPYQPIASRTPDLAICEHLPRLAQASDKFCVVRTMTHETNDHNACHYIQTGHPRPASDGINATNKEWPAMGSVVEYLSHTSGGPSREVPNYIYLPKRLGHFEGWDRPGQYAGWLGRGYDALASDIVAREKGNLFIRACTDEELDFRIKGLVPKSEFSLDRLDRRHSLLEQFDAARRGFDTAKTEAAYDRFQQRALSLVSSEKVRDALDLRQEPAALRERYGLHLFGQTTLMARRMVEAGARFVTVVWDNFEVGNVNAYSWDSHLQSRELDQYLLPGLDQALSALLGDLQDRGLLDETLVVCLGEMGRTPKPDSPQWGRGHWCHCFPALLAGAGLRTGIAYGQSDKDAAYPKEYPVRPEDLAATIFHALGIDPEMRIADPQGRPVTLVEDGRPLLNLFG